MNDNDLTTAIVREAIERFVTYCNTVDNPGGDLTPDDIRVAETQDGPTTRGDKDYIVVTCYDHDDFGFDLIIIIDGLIDDDHITSIVQVTHDAGSASIVYNRN
jgi:hypothetical protein